MSINSKEVKRSHIAGALLLIICVFLCGCMSYRLHNVSFIDTTISLKNNISSQKNIEKVNGENNRLETKFSADKETMLTPYFKDNEKNEKKNEDSTKDCLTINKLLIHPFYSETETTESFLKDLFKV